MMRYIVFLTVFLFGISGGMSNYNNHEEDQQVPELLPINKKNNSNTISNMDHSKPQGSPAQSRAPNNFLSSFMKNLSLVSPKSINSDKNPNSTKNKVFDMENESKPSIVKEDFDKKGKDSKKAVQKKDMQYNKADNEKSKENQKMKALIAQMLNSMSIKNSVTEQLYPVSNQVIQELLVKIQDEIADLNMQADRKSSNQNNLHAQKQLQVIRRQINHCNLIKQLYYQKMRYMNKTRSLEQQIISLRSQNRDLKLKISRGIQSIQNYKHNLPCDREKELIQKLSICSQELLQEKEMRQNLEVNIQTIIMNFKKLYEEAEAARKIVTGKLKEIEEKERNLKKMSLQNDAFQDPRKQDLGHSELDDRSNFTESYMEDSNSNSRNIAEEEKKMASQRQKTVAVDSDRGKQRQKERDSDRLKPQKEKSKQRQQNKQKTKQTELRIPQRQKPQPQQQDQQQQPQSLEQKIKKMRNNQAQFKKTLQF